MNLKDYANEFEYTLTTNFYEAIYLDQYGNLLDGEFDCGMRGLDHNCLLNYSNDLSHYEKWQELHSKNIVRLVPESSIALIMDNQTLNETQLNMITDNGYEIATY